MQPVHSLLRTGASRSWTNGFPIINARREITVLISPRFGIRVKYNGQVYDTIRYLKPQNKNANMKSP